MTHQIRILLGRLRRLLDGRFGTLSGESVAIGGQEVTELRPVKVSGDGNALNKAGRLVVRGHRQGSAVKIYEAANARHAEFIAAACNHSHLASCFPPVRVLSLIHI